MVRNGKMKCNWHNLKLERFRLDIKRNFFSALIAGPSVNRKLDYRGSFLPKLSYNSWKNYLQPTYNRHISHTPKVWEIKVPWGCLTGKKKVHKSTTEHSNSSLVLLGQVVQVYLKKVFNKFCNPCTESYWKLLYRKSLLSWLPNFSVFIDFNI